MRIGILGNALLDRKTGTARYTYNLIKHLSILDDANQYFIFTERRDFEHHSLNLRPNFKLVSNRVYFDNRPYRFCWEQAYLPMVLLSKRVKLFHSPETFMPLLLPCKSIVTIHDLIYQHFPETFERAHLLRLKLFTSLAVKQASKIIAVSECSKRETIEMLGVLEHKIQVIYEGVDESFRKTDKKQSLQKVEEKYRISGKFILNVGVLDKRKNLEKLIRVFSELKKEGKIKHKLVICGAKREPLYEELVGLVQKLGLSSEVIFTGFVPEDDLPLLYNACDVFIYPSLYEGFGLPVLEAMACGVPVITSNVSSLPEIADGAAVLVDPKDSKTLARAIVDVLKDSDLRRRLIGEGLKRASQFSWEKMAREHQRVYEEVLKKKT